MFERFLSHFSFILKRISYLRNQQNDYDHANFIRNRERTDRNGVGE